MYFTRSSLHLNVEYITRSYSRFHLLHAVVSSPERGVYHQELLWVPCTSHDRLFTWVWNISPEATVGSTYLTRCHQELL
ncbi:hypothetical protein RRG08_038533 [Elysia crispata]|uniref:Uncharacterized protein n=1 Tax=Elysia crispata TaxID=231223 RepID=A0AAE1B192_9GAST|nr:hypothetical protein RRG08_038533 [Elysia crispata]